MTIPLFLFIIELTLYKAKRYPPYAEDLIDVGFNRWY